MRRTLMSLVYGGLQRSDRLLPLESPEVLAATERFRLHVLDDEHDAKLREHVSFYWDKQRSYQYYQRRLLREVRSTRGPVRFVGFPQVRQSRTVTERYDTKPTTSTLPSATSAVHGAATSASSSVAATSSIVSTTQSDSSSSGDADDEGSKWSPPRALAAWNWVRLVAPYERLLCPSLLFSALLSPAIGNRTSLIYGSQPPSSSASFRARDRTTSTAASPSSSSSCVLPCVAAQWSSQTCRTLWSLHDVAAVTSLPAQEVYIMFAGTLLYLDVVITSGRVWAELEELWGSDLLQHARDSKDDDADDDGGTNRNTHRLDTEENVECEDARVGGCDAALPQMSTLAELHASLSQPPQTYASLLRHVRVLFEALLFVSPATEGGTCAAAAAAAPALFSASTGNAGTAKVMPLCPQPLLPWLRAAAEAEEWTATTIMNATSANAPTSDSSPSPLSSSLTTRRAQHMSAVAQVLKLAVREWLSRRGTTVTAVAPTGSRGVSLPMRDLRVGGTSAAASGATARSPSGATSSSAAATCGTGRSTRARGGKDSNNNNSNKKTGGNTHPTCRPNSTPRASASASARGKGSGGGASSSSSSAASAGVSIAFEAFESHDTPRAQHPFLLPPLPQDPALLVFTAVWRRTIRRCVLEKDVVRQQLRQVILGQAGQRCEELRKAVSEQQRTTETHKNEQPSPPLSSIQPPLLLLTSDPTATSFRVLGPRSGEWLTSRAGAWSGFRGELFRCIGNPPPPLLPLQSPLTPTPTSYARRSRPCTFPSIQSDSTAPHSAGSLPLVPPESFVDGALELGSSACTAPVSTEELADRLCRLGATLPRYATEVTGDRLRPGDADFVREVLQQQCLPLFLACKRRGIQQWCLRGWLKGVALTMLDNSGTESRVTTPAKLLEMSRQQLAAAMGGNDATDTTAALRMVMEGGLSEAVAFLEHVQKRKERTLRWLPVTKVSSSGAGVAGASGFFSAGLPLPFSAVEALLLRRAEESAIFSIFQCHPQAVALTGCGVQRLALHASTHKIWASLLLVRTCGVVVEWDMQDCYEPPRHRRLRVPKRIVTESRKKSTAAASGAGASGAAVSAVSSLSEEDVPPPEIGGATERLTLRHVRGMLQYYCHALTTSAAPTPSASASHTTPTVNRASGAKRLREGDEAVADAAACKPEHALNAKDEEARPQIKQEKAEEEEEEVKRETGGNSSPASPSSASQSQPTNSEQTALENRTSLFPIDRAVALFVLRHHPQYYTQVVGCGIKEVFVAISAALGADVDAEHTSSARRRSAVADSADAAPQVLDDEAVPTSSSTSAHSVHTAVSSSPSSGASLRPVLVVERVCGQRVEVDVEACYDHNAAGCPLRPRAILV